MRRIVLPQAVRRMVAPLVNQSITQLKNTALLYRDTTNFKEAAVCHLTSPGSSQPAARTAAAVP